MFYCEICGDWMDCWNECENCDVWKEEYDPEFGLESVDVSKKLKEEYRKVADEKKVHFLAASDYAVPSQVDMEHLDEYGHAALADRILDFLQQKQMLE